jgi:hypothetical protein
LCGASNHALGIATGAIGIAELAGEVLVATISDRFGLETMLCLWVKDGSPKKCSINLWITAFFNR